MTTLAHSPRMRTRLQAAAAVPTVEEVASVSERSTEPSAGNETLQAALREIQELREEQARFRQRETELIVRLQGSRESVELQRQMPGQSILCDNSTQNAVNSLGYKVKPDLYDGSVSLREFITQFELIAKANGWGESAKAVALAASLRGKARSILDGISALDSVTFKELKSKLELRFGESLSTQTSYSHFINRKQKFGEDLPTLGADLERLSRLAYPECSFEIRDKIACAQFIVALSDGFVKRTLQLEGITSLRVCIERALAIKLIQENSFPQKRGNYGGKFSFEKEGGNHYVGKEGKKEEKGEGKFKGKIDFKDRPTGKFAQQRECWQCGKKGHFRAECPSLSLTEKGNLD